MLSQHKFKIRQRLLDLALEKGPRMVSQDLEE